MEIDIDNTCYETYPCKHWVSFDGKRKMMGALEIMDLLQKYNLEIPVHFNYLKGFKKYNDKVFNQHTKKKTVSGSLKYDNKMSSDIDKFFESPFAQSGSQMGSREGKKCWEDHYPIAEFDAQIKRSKEKPSIQEDPWRSEWETPNKPIYDPWIYNSWKKPSAPEKK